MITLFMIPLIWWFLTPLFWGAIGGLVGGIVASIIDEMNKVAKRFTILGEKASGKTTLHHFLTTGEVYVGEYKPGSSGKVTPKNILKMRDLELVVKESEDIAGGKQYRDQWNLLVKEADVICYLIRGDKVYAENREYISLIKEHIAQIQDAKEDKEHIAQMHDAKEDKEHIAQMHDAKKGSQKLYLLITYLDTIPEYNEKAEVVKERISEILKTSAFKRDTKAIYGSLKTQETTELLVEQLIDNILKDSKNKL